MILAVTALLSCGVGYGWPNGGQSVKARETAFDHVKRTGVLRCGYVVAEPFLLKDPNTGVLSGIAYDFVQALGHELEVRVEWSEESGWGDFAEGLNAGRFDMMCVPVWQSGARARAALLTRPLYLSDMYAFARADDDRFDESFNTVNRKDVRIAVIDGDISQSLRRLRFSEAQELALPQISDNGQYILSVISGKADVSFQNMEGIQSYNRKATRKIKLIAKGAPVRSFANVLAVRLGETGFKNALDSVLESLENDGTADAIIKKYPGFRLRGNRESP